MPQKLAAPAATPRTSRLLTLVCTVAIVAATILAFAPAIENEFLYWDDENNLMFNTHIRSFSAENLEWMWKSSLLGVWQPLTWMITAAEYQLFGRESTADFSRGMHVASVALHALAAVLVFVVVRRLIALGTPESATRSPTGLTLGATFAALFFAVHPLRTETVAWASGQPYILAMIPALACIWCYLRAHQTGGLRWHAAALACLGASLLCKAMAVPLVGVLLVIDWYPLRRIGGAGGWRAPAIRRVLVEKLPYLAVTLIVVALTVWATRSTKTYRPEPLAAKLLVASFCMMFYATLTFVPHRLAPYYMRPTPFRLGDPWFIAAAVAFVAVTLAFIAMRRRRPWLLATWAAYVLVLLPVVGLIKHGGQMAADRYSYLSCIGWAALLGALFLRLWLGNPSRARNVRRGVTLLAAAGVVVGLSVMTWQYCPAWHDSVSVWTAMVERNPDFQMGYYNLAKAHKRPCEDLLKRAAQAEKSSDEPTASRLRSEAGKRYALAEASYRKAIELYPQYPEANVDLANMIRDGKAPGGADAALDHYRRALKGRPGFYMANFNIGTFMLQQRRYAEAVHHLELAEADAAKQGDRKRLPAIRKALEYSRRKLAPE